MKKKKLALATAIATLTASLSVFSGVPASAKVIVSDFEAFMLGIDKVVNWRTDEIADLKDVPREEIVWDMDFVVVSTVSHDDGIDDCIYVASPDYLRLRPLESFGYNSYTKDQSWMFRDAVLMSAYFGIGEHAFIDAQSEMFKYITEQAKLGDIIHYHAENGGAAYIGSGYDFWMDEEIASEYETNDTFTITGSIFDTPFENIKPYVDGDLVATQITYADGTDVIMENQYWSSEDPSIWLLSEGKKVPSETVKDEPEEPEGTWLSDKMVVVDVTDDAVFVAWDGEAPANDKRGMDYNFYKIDKSSPEMAEITNDLKYGDIIRYRGTGEMVFAGNPLIDDMSFTSGEGELEILGSVVKGSYHNFTAVTSDGVTYLLMNDTSYDTCYIIESRADHNTITDFLTWVSEDHTDDSTPHKFDWKKDGAFWIRPNEDGDVNSDNKVDSADAAVLLEEIALSAVGDTGRMNASENQVADVNGDGKINAKDAAVILSYSAEVGSGMLEDVSLKAYAAQ
ncbi:MAG: dockerin type I repeat-containing protein [Oscillospiraceae bacterium]|nr:dockerin type I repeat-containing protein [Oscillospiraceae bacterium]